MAYDRVMPPEKVKRKSHWMNTQDDICGTHGNEKLPGNAILSSTPK